MHAEGAEWGCGVTVGTDGLDGMGWGGWIMMILIVLTLWGLVVAVVGIAIFRGLSGPRRPTDLADRETPVGCSMSGSPAVRSTATSTRHDARRCERHAGHTRDSCDERQDV